MTDIHGHPADSDGLTCVFFARCPENSDIAIYRSVHASALEVTGGDKDRARSMTEAYMSGRIGALPAGTHRRNKR